MDPILAAIVGGTASILGQNMSNAQSAQNAALNVNMQQQYAAHGLEWRAKDARAAEADTGINALTLLGAPTNSFSSIAGGTDAGAGVSAAGQNISRALMANRDQNDKMNDLQMQLLEAKIANVNSDTARLMAVASRLATTHGAAGTPTGIRTGDPLAVNPSAIPLVQQAYDPRTGETIWIPSEKAASPLQTIAASPVNVTMAARSATEGLVGHPGSGFSWGVPDWFTVRPDVARQLNSQDQLQYGGM